MISNKMFMLSLSVMVMFPILMFFAMLWGLIGAMITYSIILLFVMMGDHKYPVNVILYSKRKNGYAVKITKAGRFNDKKTKKSFYIIKDGKLRIKPSDFGNVIETKSGLWATLYQPNSDEYIAITDVKIDLVPLKPGEAAPEGVPIQMIDNVPHIYPPVVSVNKILEGGLIVMDEDTKFWLANELDRAHERWHQEKSTWEQYYPVISVAVLGIMMAIILWANAQYSASVTEQLAGAANVLSQATNSLTAAFKGGVLG